MIPRLKQNFDKEITKSLMTKLNVKNKHEVPKFTKIILNMGLGEAVSDKKIVCLSSNCVNPIVMPST